MPVESEKIQFLVVVPDVGDHFWGEPVHPLQESAFRRQELHRLMPGVRGGDMKGFLEDPRQFVRLPLHRVGETPSVPRAVPLRDRPEGRREGFDPFRFACNGGDYRYAELAGERSHVYPDP